MTSPEMNRKPAAGRAIDLERGQPTHRGAAVRAAALRVPHRTDGPETRQQSARFRGPSARFSPVECQVENPSSIFQGCPESHRAVRGACAMGRVESRVRLLPALLQLADLPFGEQALRLFAPRERLGHLAHEVLGDVEHHVGREVHVRRLQILPDPDGQLPDLVGAAVASVGEDHETWTRTHRPITRRRTRDGETVVALVPDDPPDALSGLAQGVEVEVVSVRDAESLLQVREARQQHSGAGVLVGDADHQNAPAVVSVEVDPLGHLSPGDAEEHAAPAAVARPAIVLQGRRRLGHVLQHEGDLPRRSGRPRDLRFEEGKLVTRDLVQDLHDVPLLGDLLHVVVAHEEADDAVRDRATEFDQQPPVVPDHGVLVSHVDLGAHLPHASE